MTVHSGQFSAIDGIAQVRNWQISDDGSLSRGVNSASAMGHFSRKGITQWNGGFACHGALPAVFPSERFTFLGYTSPDNDISGDGLTYGGSAILDALGINWNWAGGQVIEHSAGFSGHLALTPTPADDEVLDATFTDPEPIGVCKIMKSIDGATFTELTDLVSAQLNISAANQAYINSGTASGTGRVPGPIDWNLSIVVEDALAGHGLTKFTDYAWRLYTTATLYYELKWGMVKSFTGITADRETHRVIQHTINIEMNCVKAAGGAFGHILKPGGATWWPFS